MKGRDGTHSLEGELTGMGDGTEGSWDGCVWTVSGSVEDDVFGSAIGVVKVEGVEVGVVVVD